MTSHADSAVPFEDSRRLFGPSYWLRRPGAILDVNLDHSRGAPYSDIDSLVRTTEDWRSRIEWLVSAIRWKGVEYCNRAHSRGVSLGLTARFDVLYSATSMNEWAWRGAAIEAGDASAADSLTPDDLPLDPQEAVQKLERMISAEANPALRILVQMAREMGLPTLVDEETVSVGYGRGSLSWSPQNLPRPDDIDWGKLGTVPTVLVTGSNGKTTTVRILAAILRDSGHKVGFCCTDGVSVSGEMVETGDWSGPTGAKRVLRDQAVTAAVIETARGGLLRRGLVVSQADAAIITNVDADHLGDYGLESVHELIDTKLVVAQSLGDTGTLILNHDDGRLAEAVGSLAVKKTFFSLADPSSLPVPRPEQIPVSAGGRAAHNIANAMAASLAASVIGVHEDVIAATLMHFGSSPDDNPGRLMRFELGGITLLLDYAHNPSGMSALMAVARTIPAERRLLVLGQAGDRTNEAILELAAAAWHGEPDYIVIKELDGYLRGRASGEVPGLIRNALIDFGADESSIEIAPTEMEAISRAFGQALPGDLLILPVHNLSARQSTLALIASLRQTEWQAGDAISWTD